MKIDKSQKARLNITGLKAVFNILGEWGCSPEQSVLTLDLEKSAYDDCRKDINKASLSDEQQERVSYILNIHAALRMIFDNPENLWLYVDE